MPSTLVLIKIFVMPDLTFNDFSEIFAYYMYHKTERVAGTLYSY